MRLHKKITAVLITLVMFSGCMGETTFAQDAATGENIVSEQYVETVKKLTSLGIYSFENEAPDSVVTRGQFACIVTDLLGVDGVGVDDVTEYFSDVDNTTMYAEEISEAVSLGIMNGMGSGKFCPDNAITYIQALKTVLTALGYQPVAKGRGDYPWGYISCGAELGISKGGPSDYNEALTFEMAVRMIELAAEAPVFECIAVTEDTSVFTKNENAVLLNVYHGIEFSRGLMTDNGITAISSESSIGNENVKIGSRVLYTTDASVKQYLGYNVEYYYRSDANSDFLLYATVYENHNDWVVINAKDLLIGNEDFTKTSVVAQINGKKQTYKINPNADFIYNGVIDKTFTSNSMKIENGTLTLIDADLDGVYELVKAEEYVDILVSALSVSDNKLLAKIAPLDNDDNESYNVIDYKEFKSVVFEDANGETVPSESIKADSVVSVFRSKDKKTSVRFVLGLNTSEITVKEIYEDDSGYHLIDGVNEYVLSASYEKMIGKSAGYPKPELGEMYRIYLNYEGDIAIMEKIDSRTQYAYFMSIGTKPGLKNNVQLKLYLDSNDCVIVNTAKKVEINQIKGKNPENLMNEGTGLVVNGEITPQLVKIKLNSNGELTYLETAGEKVSNVYGFDLNKFSLVYVNGYTSDTSTSTLYSGTAARAVGGGYCVNKNTKIFRIESRNVNPVAYSEDDIEVISYSTFCDRYGGSYITLYDSDEAWACGAAVVSQKIGTESRFFTVDSCKYVIDENGEEKIKVSGWWKGLYWTFREARPGIITEAIKTMYPTAQNTTLKKGDLIEITFDHNQELDDVSLLWSPALDPDRTYSEKPENASGSSHISTAEKFLVLGTPCIVADGRIGIYTGSAENPFWVSLMSTNPNIYKYDMAEDTLTKITEKEIPVAAVLNSTGDGYDIVDSNTKIFIIRSRSIVSDVYVVTNVDNN